MRFDDTKGALERYRDDERFEELSSRLLSQDEPRIRPLGGRADRARDAVGGLYRLGVGEELVAMYSLRKDWDHKIADELSRIQGFGWRPKDVIAVTNRTLDRDKERVLQRKASANGWALTIYGQEWIANKLHLRGNLDLRTEYLGLARPEPDLFMLADDFRVLLDGRGLLPVDFVARERVLRAALDRLATGTTNLAVEADGGIGKTRLVYEMSQEDSRGRRWFFVPEGLPFHPARLSDLESGDEMVVVVDDAHRRPDLRSLLAGLERRVPRPQLVLIVRPGYQDVIEQACQGLAFDEPEKICLPPLRRKDIVALLRQSPLGVKREGTLLSIVQLSAGNPQIAILAGRLAASGRAPHDLRKGNVFREYVNSILDVAPATAPEARELLALIAAARTIDLASAHDVTAVTSITGLDAPGLRRQLDVLADSGLVAESSSSVFTIKPDILSEEILRYSFFDGKRRPTLRYTTVYEAFAPQRRIDFLHTLGEAGVASAPAAEEALRMVRADVLPSVRTASPESLQEYARFASATAGIPDICFDLIDALIARLPELADGELDSVARELIGALSHAKFGDFRRGFHAFLRLGSTLFVDSGTETKAEEALQKEISEVYRSCPVDYSDDDSRILAGIQVIVCDEIERFWHPDEANEGDVVTAAIASRGLLTLVYEHFRPAAEDAMSIRMYGVGIPATPLTHTALQLGARLFCETFLRLSAKLQIAQLKSLREIDNAAAGHIGMFGYQPGPDVQALAGAVLKDVIEPWLRENLVAMPLPAAAEVLGYFEWPPRPGRRPGRLNVATRLREYVDLIHPANRRLQARSWGAEQEAVRRQAEKYAKRLLAAKDPLKVIDRWNAWLEEARLALDKSPWRQTLPLTLVEVGKRDADLGRAIAEHIYEKNLPIGAYGTPLVETIAATSEGRDLADAWLRRPQPHLRCAAATAAAALGDEESRPTLARLAQDKDPDVRAAVWDTLYRLGRPLSEWQLDVMLELSRKPSLDRWLELLLVRLANGAKQVQEEGVALTNSQKATIAELVLATAQTERVPHQGVGDMLGYASKLGLDLVEEWLLRRISYLRDAGPGVYPGDLPDDLGPMVRAGRDALSSKNVLARLFTLYEEDDLPWFARQATEEMIGWLADDTPELTAQIVKWGSQADPGLSHATTFLARTRDWDLYSERARLLLRVRPYDSRLETAIIKARRPIELWGSGEPQYRAEAEHFATWLEADDSLLVMLGRKAVDHYSELADQAAAEDERDNQGFFE